MMNTYAILVSGVLSGAVNLLTIEASGTEQQVDDETGAPTRKVFVYNHMLPEKNKWKITKGGRQVNGCKGGPYSQWYATAQTSCRIPSGSYTVTCCDARNNQGWSGGYIKIAGSKQKLCKKFTFGAKRKCYTQNFRVAKIPTPRPTPRPTPPQGKIEDLRRCLSSISTKMTNALPYVYKYKNAVDGRAGSQMISDGGFDMFDSGNRLFIRDSGHTWSPSGRNTGLRYTNTCSSNGGWSNAGRGDIKYFTCMYKVRRGNSAYHSGDIFFAGFKSAGRQISGFQTLGGLGADNVAGSRIVTSKTKWPNGKMWVYRKSIVPAPRKTGQKDPTINHLIFVPRSDWNHYWPRAGLTTRPVQGSFRDTRRRRLYTTDYDYQGVEGGTRVKQVLYVMWGGHSGQWHYEYNQNQINGAIYAVKCWR
jgi:hypothetical protein